MDQYKRERWHERAFMATNVATAMLGAGLILASMITATQESASTPRPDRDDYLNVEIVDRGPTVGERAKD